MRINRQIRISPVRLVDADGSQVGVVPIEDALSLANERNLDLVEVAPSARPPVGLFWKNDSSAAHSRGAFKEYTSSKQVLM